MTRGILIWDILEERTYDTMQPLVDTVFSLVPHVHQFYSDGLATYDTLVYRQGKRVARHDVAPGKEQTYTIEGTNADLRCYVPPLARKSRCFPRHIEKFRSLVRLFVTCFNHCCLARFKYPNRNFYPSDFLPALF
jgi:IS1 family transposase